MANKNTRQARKRGLSNNPEIIVGSGTGRNIQARHAEPVFKGSACNTSRPPGKKKWVGAKRAGEGKNLE